MLGLFNLIALPILYALELGFYGFVLVITLLTIKRRRPLDRETLFELTVFSTSIVIASLLKSAIRNNDLGWRGLMFAQFVLIIWGSDYIFNMFANHRKKDEDSPERFWGGWTPPKIRWAMLNPGRARQHLNFGRPGSDEVLSCFRSKPIRSDL